MKNINYILFMCIPNSGDWNMQGTIYWNMILNTFLARSLPGLSIQFIWMDIATTKGVCTLRKNGFKCDASVLLMEK